MGTVYRAEVTGSVPGLDPGCAVALKLVHAHLLSQPGFFKRFLREAQIGQDVQHENVVRTFDCDATEADGKAAHFLVMEYVEGQTLRDLLKELDRVPEELCRHIGREVAKGLAAIHEAGVVHRDLKPENVLITPDHVVKIMDLGVARLQAEAVRLSQTGAFVGSLEYAAPEQFRSSDGEPDGRADLHALGVLLYELATGQHPYRDEDAAKVIGHILNDTPRKAGEVNPQLSPFFEEVVQTLIAKDREARFGAAADLASILEDGEKSEWWKERARALRVETKRPLRRIRIPRETALYGRDEDLAWLQAAYEQAKVGEGQALLIEGEAGIGKTRLVDEFVERLRQEGEDINFLFGSYPPGGAATVAGAFAQAYREHLGAEDLEATLRRYLPQTPILIPAYAALLKGDSPPKDAEPLSKDSLQTVFVEATRGLAAERTTVVLIDDLHFAPEDGRALFTSLALAVPEHSILLVGTMRPGVPEEWSAGITRLDHAEQRSLNRLGPKELGKLLRDAFRSDRLADELGWRIAEKSDGNPFFAFEIIRGLREGQSIARQADGTWVTTKSIQDIQMPSSVLDLVNARVADLAEEERDLLDVASCCGFDFDPTLVGDVVGLPRVAALKRFGQVERRHRLVRSAGRDYRFDHHQVQEALYGSLNERLRDEYHAAIAEALETRTGAAAEDPKDLDGSLCVDLCEHYLKGARGASARRYLDAASARLERSFLNAQAIQLSERALAMPGLLTGVERARTLLWLGDVNGPLDRLGRLTRQEACLREAERLAEEAGDEFLRGVAENALIWIVWRTSSIEEAEAAFRRALDAARARGDRKTEAVTAGNLGVILFVQGRLAAAREQYEQGLRLHRELGNRRGEAAAMGNLGNVLLTQGRFTEAREHLERGLAMHRSNESRRGEADATGNLGIVFFSQGRLRQAWDHFERHLALSREIGNRQGEATARGNLGNVCYLQGRLEAAKEHHEQNLAMTREIQYRTGEALALHNLGEVLKERGETSEGEECLRACLALCEEIGHRHVAVMAHLSLGSLRAAAGDGAGARASLVAARDLAAEHGFAGHETLARCELACLPGGDAQDALASYTEHEERLAAHERRKARLRLFQATGDRAHLADAKRLLDEALTHVPEEYRESMRKNVRLNREIMEAWAEHGEKA